MAWVSSGVFLKRNQLDLNSPRLPLSEILQLVFYLIVCFNICLCAVLLGTRKKNDKDSHFFVHHITKT